MPKKKQQQQVCKYFRSKNGCRLGDKCQFLHEAAAAASPSPTAAIITHNSGHSHSNGTTNAATTTTTPTNNSNKFHRDRTMARLSGLLTDLTNTITDSIITKIDYHTEIIDELVKENKELREIALRTRETCFHLSEQVLSELQTVHQQNDELIAERDHIVRALEEESERQSSNTVKRKNDEPPIPELIAEQSRNEQLKAELKASQDLVAELLRMQNNDTRTTTSNATNVTAPAKANNAAQQQCPMVAV